MRLFCIISWLFSLYVHPIRWPYTSETRLSILGKAILFEWKQRVCWGTGFNFCLSIISPLKEIAAFSIWAFLRWYLFTLGLLTFVRFLLAVVVCVPNMFDIRLRTAHAPITVVVVETRICFDSHFSFAPGFCCRRWSPVVMLLSCWVLLYSVFGCLAYVGLPRISLDRSVHSCSSHRVCQSTTARLSQIAVVITG